MIAATAAVGASLCRCKHPKLAHEHYTPSKHCAFCMCSRFRRRPGRREVRWAILFAALFLLGSVAVYMLLFVGIAALQAVFG